MLRSVRILPAVIFVAALMLTVRLGGVWQRVDGVVVAGAPAQAAEAEPGADADAATDDPPAPNPLGLPKLDFTAEELKVLQGLAARRQALERRESDLAMREGLLEVAEKRIETMIAEMETIKEQVEGLIHKYDEQEESELRRMVKIYETMKPKDAARILQELEMDILLAITERMKERITAPVLAAMKAERARMVTTELTRRREIRLYGPLKRPPDLPPPAAP